MIDEKMVKNILQEYKMHNCHVTFRGDYSVDQFIDAIEGNRKYIKCLYVYNKVDTISIEDVNAIARVENQTVLSCTLNLGTNLLLDKIWEMLSLVRVYTKKKGCGPEFEEPIILTDGRHGKNVRAAILQLHKSLLTEFNYANVWGKSTKYNPQKCGMHHILEDEDVM